jgi:hypothetical protein
MAIAAKMMNAIFISIPLLELPRICRCEFLSMQERLRHGGLSFLSASQRPFLLGRKAK